MKPVDPVAIDTGRNPYVSPENGDSPYTKSHGPDDLPSQLTEYGYGFWFRYTTTYPVR